MFKKYNIELEQTFDKNAPLFIDSNNKLRYNNGDQMLVDNSNTVHLHISHYYLIASTNNIHNKPKIPQSLIDHFMSEYNDGRQLNSVYLEIDDDTETYKINDKNEIISMI